MTCFIQNKYKSLYFRILENHNPGKEDHTEIHHIIPKSLGGSDSKENLKRISTRVHYICHYLLTKFTSGQAKRSMILAFNMMNTGHNGKRYFNSRLYQQNRKLMPQIMSNLNKGENNPQFGKIWFTNTITCKRTRFSPSQIEEAISQNWTTGYKDCIEYKQHIASEKRKLKGKELAESLYTQFINSGLDSISKFAESIGSSQPRISMLFNRHIEDYKLNRKHGKKFGATGGTRTHNGLSSPDYESGACNQYGVRC